MNEYIFILGNYPDIAKAEIKSIFGAKQIKASYSSVSSKIFLVNTEATINCQEILNELGGTVKIAKIEQKLGKFNANDLAQIIYEKVFGLSFYDYKISNNEILKLSKEIKEIVGKKTNFVIPKKDSQLSSAQVFFRLKKGVEVIVIKTEKGFYIGKTCAVQDIKFLNLLDYGIPRPDPISGMLPPKLANMMINLSLGEKYGNNFSIYDPFCGHGRILIQSMLRDFNYIGSDIDENAVSDARENLNWASKKFNKNFKNNWIFKHDARNNVKYDMKFDAIVAEPYLGPALKQLPSNQEIEKITNNLAKLYIQSLRNLKYSLKSDGKVVFVVPIIGKVKVLDKIIDNLASFGYHMVETFEYFRKYQVVKRQIVVFSIKKK